jgi:hypothetical protein
VRIADEEALVAWDPERHVEHFVRRATFVATGKDFGFLVPTPSRPELGEVDESLFDRLAERLVPEVVVRHAGVTWTVGSLFLMTRGKSAAVAIPAAQRVRVLDETRVAGLDAAVLEADDASALAKWLADHGYASGPTLDDWLAPYVAKKWKVTAFKMASSSADAVRTVASKAVRMSFSTEAPFYPYRERADQRETMPASFGGRGPSSRSLRVFVLSSARMAGTLGERAPWHASLALAEPADPALVQSLGLPSFADHDRWLTVLEDRESPRPGTDEVFFAASTDGKPWPVPPVVVSEPREIMIPLEGVPAVGLVVVVWVARRRRRTLGNAAS